jgi:tryptophanyl-tRNA synthetase
MKRMHAFKDKLQKGEDAEGINMGLFCYPILMAADILIFKPDLIPVGEDQTQHVEVTRDMAQAFNNRYGEILKVPDLYIKKEVARVKGTDGERKMSKSLGNDISVFADEEVVRKQIMGITTDPTRVHPSDPGDPAKNPCFDYLELIEYDQCEIDKMKDQYKEGTIGDVVIKKLLFEEFLRYFKPFREKKKELDEDMDYVEKIRKEGAEKANEIANETLKEVKGVIGV